MTNSPIGQTSNKSDMVIAWEPRAPRTDPAILRDPLDFVELLPSGHLVRSLSVTDVDSFHVFEKGRPLPENKIISAEWQGGYEKTYEKLGNALEPADLLKRSGGFELMKKGDIPDRWLENVGRFRIYNPEKVKNLHMSVAIHKPEHPNWGHTAMRPAGLYNGMVFVGLQDAFKPELAHIA